MSIKPELPRGQIGSAAINAALADAVTADEYTVTTLPAAADHKGKTISVTDGAAGSACLAYSNGTAWLRILLGAAVAAT